MGTCNNKLNEKHRKIIQSNNPTNSYKESNKLNNSSQNIKESSFKEMIKENPNNISINENYYLICPQCKIRSPHIEKLYYKEDIEEFMVKYTCICFENTFESK